MKYKRLNKEQFEIKRFSKIIDDYIKKIINFSKETNISVSETIFNELTDVLNYYLDQKRQIH